MIAVSPCCLPGVRGQVSAVQLAAGLDLGGWRNYSATVPREFRQICDTVKELLAKQGKELVTNIGACTSAETARLVRPLLRARRC